MMMTTTTKTVMMMQARPLYPENIALVAGTDYLRGVGGSEREIYLHTTVPTHSPDGTSLAFAKLLDPLVTKLVPVVSYPVVQECPNADGRGR